MCAADKELMPTTSTSSWIAVPTTASGVCLSPVKDDFHPGIAQRMGDDGHADRVRVEAELREQHPDPPLGSGVASGAVVQWRIHASIDTVT
jgi:hypothetical protein